MLEKSRDMIGMLCPFCAFELDTGPEGPLFKSPKLNCEPRSGCADLGPSLSSLRPKSLNTFIPSSLPGNADLDIP
jgi:hypothetical protein